MKKEGSIICPASKNFNRILLTKKIAPYSSTRQNCNILQETSWKTVPEPSTFSSKLLTRAEVKMNVVKVPEWILIRTENERKAVLDYIENLDLKPRNTHY